MRAFKAALCISLSGAHFSFPMLLMACSWFLASPGYAWAPVHLTIRLTARMLAKPERRVVQNTQQLASKGLDRLDQRCCAVAGSDCMADLFDISNIRLVFPPFTALSAALLPINLQAIRPRRS